MLLGELIVIIVTVKKTAYIRPRSGIFMIPRTSLSRLLFEYGEHRVTHYHAGKILTGRGSLFERGRMFYVRC